MDQKTWLWRKKSSEKITVSSDKVNLSSNKNEEETLLTDKARLEKDLEIANDKLSLALSECKKKDELVKKLENTEQEAIAGWEKTKAEVASLKQELNDAVQKRIDGEERVVHLDAALKECMQQLRFVREEQEQRIHDALSKTSKEYEKSQRIVEEKLADTGKRLSKLGVENTQLSKALLVKEKIIEDLNRQLADVEADFNAMVSRLESSEKDNAFLNYEVRVLEKEVEVRNEERQFNRRTMDASHKQHLESVKKIAKLESECQRLRLLVRKRLPGPGALVKMKNEVEMLGRDSFEIRRRQLNPNGSVVASSLENSLETPNKRISTLTSRLSVLEEENNVLKEAVNKKNNELQFLKTVHSRASSKFLQIESPCELSNGHKTMESGRSSLTLPEVPLPSMSDTGSDDKVSCAESWASALISELEHFKTGKQKGLTSCKIVGSSELDLMDDFAEMEKLAIVSVEKPVEYSLTCSNEVSPKPRSLETGLNGCFPEVIYRETVPMPDLGSCLTYTDAVSVDISMAKVTDWHQNILKMVFDRSSLLKRDPEQIIEDLRSAMKYQNSEKLVDMKENTIHRDEPNIPYNRDCLLGKPLVTDSLGEASDIDITKKCNQHQVDLRSSLLKLIELVEGISLPSSDADDLASRKDGNLYSETPTGYMARVFQWKTSELSAILKKFTHTCYELLNGKGDVVNVLQVLNSTLDWIMNHCFSLQDVSSMRYSIKKRFDWDESRSDCELEIGMTIHSSEVDKSHVPKEHASWLEKDAASNYCNPLTEDLQPIMSEENRKLKEELVSVESAKENLEGKFESVADEDETLTNQLQESEQKVVSLQKELEILKDLKGTIENQIVNQQIVNQDLDTQLTAARIELNEAHRKLLALEVELENKNNCFEELEATCLELQLQLESTTRKQNPSTDIGQEEKQLRTEREITTASEKLAECQETILNLGKQLKALATPKEAALLDKVIMISNEETHITSISTTATATIAADPTPTVPEVKTTNNRFSLLDQMLAEDDATTRERKFLKAIEGVANCSSTSHPDKPTDSQKAILIWNGQKNGSEKDKVGTLAIVPGKKRGDTGLWRKLLWRKKRVKNQRKSLPFA